VFVEVFGLFGPLACQPSADWDLNVAVSDDGYSNAGWAATIGTMEGATNHCDIRKLSFQPSDPSCATAFSYAPALGCAEPYFMIQYNAPLTGLDQKSWTVYAYAGAEYPSGSGLLLSIYADPDMAPPQAVGGVPYEYVVSIVRDPTGTYVAGRSWIYPAGVSSSPEEAPIQIPFNNAAAVTAVDPAVVVASKGIQLLITARPAADDLPPAIQLVDVSPAKVAAGDPVHVTVEATDNVAVTSVTANGAALTHLAGSTWTGTLTAPEQLGSHSVKCLASDLIGNTTTSAASYSTVRSFGISLRGAKDAVAVAASGEFLFTVWGKVSQSTSGGFVLDDGSGAIVSVQAMGHGLSAGEFARARGALDSHANPPALTAHVVNKLN